MIMSDVICFVLSKEQIYLKINWGKKGFEFDLPRYSRFSVTVTSIISPLPLFFFFFVVAFRNFLILRGIRIAKKVEIVFFLNSVPRRKKTSVKELRTQLAPERIISPGFTLGKLLSTLILSMIVGALKLAYLHSTILYSTILYYTILHYRGNSYTFNLPCLKKLSHRKIMKKLTKDWEST